MIPIISDATKGNSNCGYKNMKGMYNSDIPPNTINEMQKNAYILIGFDDITMIDINIPILDPIFENIKKYEEAVPDSQKYSKGCEFE